MNLEKVAEQILSDLLEYIEQKSIDPKLSEKKRQKYVQKMNTWCNGDGRKPTGRGLNHVVWMLEGIGRGYIQGEKGHRWLGYIQGVLVEKKIFTLEEMKKVNYEN